MVKAVILFLFSSAAVFAAVMSSSLREEQPCGKMLGNQRPVGLSWKEKAFIAEMKAEMKSMNRKLKAQELDIERQNYEMKALKVDQEQKNLQLGTGPSSGFSVFLSKNIMNLKVDDTIIFDTEVISSTGNYDTSSGVFKVPEDGVYLFSIFITTMDEDFTLQAELVVSGRGETDAIANTEHPGMISQGGNVVILQLSKGNLVSVVSKSNSKIVSAANRRFSTFSGFKIYDA